MRTQLHSRPLDLQYPFGVQNPNRPKALQFPYDPRIVLSRFVEIVTHKILCHSNVPVPLLPERRSVTARQGGLRTHPTGAKPRSFAGLTGCPEEGMLTLSSYQPSCQTGFGFYNESLAPDRAGLSRFPPTTDSTIPSLNTNFHRSFACFAFDFCSSGGRLFFSGEPFEGQDWRCDHVTQGVEKQIGTLPAIEPKAHLFQIGSKVLCAHTMPCSHNAALQKRECGFNGIGVNIAVYVDSILVAYYYMAITVNARLHHGLRISGPVIREHHFNIRRDIFLDVLGECAGLRILCMEETQFPAALTDTDYDLFAFLHVLMALLFSADVGLIHFDLAIQHWLIGLGHRVPDAVAEVPRCFVTADSESAPNLTSGHALLRLAKQKRCGEPLYKGQVGIIEYRASGDGELVVTVFAVEQLLLGFEFDHGSLAAQAARPFREAQARQKLTALLFGREHGVYVN